jgi:tetratricopeptide (TPR) repeat protein
VGQLALRRGALATEIAARVRARPGRFIALACPQDGLLVWLASGSPTFGDATAADLRAQLSRGNSRTVSECFRQTTEPNLREFYVTALHEWEGRPGVFEDWKRKAPDDPAAWLLAGAHSTCWAWEARGGGRADTVTGDMGELFIERLDQAADELMRAAALAPEDPLPHAYLILVCLGLNLDQDKTRGYFDEALRRYPESHAAHFFMLGYLCEKWHGSHAEMFALARDASSHAPEGSLVHELIPQAHTERWLYAVHFADEPGGEDYFRQAHVRDEIFAAYDRSIGSPRHSPTPLTRIVANYWAYALSRCGDWPNARREFERVGEHPTIIPWGFHDAPTQAMRTFRERVQEDPAAHPVPAPAPPRPWWKIW